MAENQTKSCHMFIEMYRYNRTRFSELKADAYIYEFVFRKRRLVRRDDEE